MQTQDNQDARAKVVPDGTLSTPVDRAAVMYPDDVPAPKVTPPPPPTPSIVPQSAAQLPTDKDPGAVLYPDDQPKGDGPPASPHGAPDSAYTIAVPDGLQMSREVLAEVEPVFRALNLSNEGASKLMPLAASYHERILDGQQSEFSEMKTAWAKQAKADPEIGRGNWPETDRLITLTLGAAGGGKGSPLMALLDESGLGNHPEIIRAFRRIGAKLEGKRA